MTTSRRSPDNSKLDQVVAQANRDAESRQRGYRERALTMYPWVCGRCGRSFDRSNISQLTVHHRNHNHEDNPVDGSNWELLCLFCHDNEHQRQVELGNSMGLDNKVPPATSNPFADLAALLNKRK